MNRFVKGFIAIVSCATILTGDLLSVNAAEQKNKDSIREFTKEEIQTFVDSYFKENMGKYNTPGAAVAVVKGDSELMSCSYGVSDLDTGTEVDANTTFPACSVSKLFTATAVMKLAEEGHIDLNEDITTYLEDIRIENKYDKAVTCASLLTHSSGLDEQSELNGSTLDKDSILTQKDFFDIHIPTVIHEPGSISCYSNIGYNLLGYVVEKVSGQSYESYIQDNILEPLSMNNSSVRIDNDNMASGYQDDGNGNEIQGFAYQYTSGSSGVISTVKDMEHFMIMYLNGGAYQGRKILGSDTVCEMQDRQFANAPVYDGMGYGWIRDNYNGKLILKHEGALPGYTTTLFLLPDEDIGVYVATNSTTGICFNFEEAFCKHFYGERIQDNSYKVTDIDYSEVDKYTGTYRNYDGVGRSNIMKIAVLFDDTDMVVTKADNGQLKVALYNQEKKREETLVDYCGNGVFSREDGKGYITFNTEYAFTNVSHCTYEKVNTMESKSVLIAGWATIPLMLITSVVLLIRILRKKIGLTVRPCALLTMTGQFIEVISLITVIALVMQMIMCYQYSMIWLLKVLLIILILGIIMSFGSVFYGIYLGCRKRISKRTVALICSTVLIQTIFISELLYFNLLGIHIY